MKRIVLLLAILFCIQIQAQRKPKIKGNKNVVEVIEDLPGFNAIELKDDLDIYIQNTGEEGFVLNADDNLIDVLKFKVEDSILYVSSFYKITSKKKLDLTINYHSLDAITVRNGRIRMNDVLESEELSVAMYESAKLQLNANAPIVHVHMEGNSSGDLSVEGDSLNVILNDRTDLRLYATTTTINLDMSENSGAKLDGTTSDFNMHLSGNATLKSEKLQTSKIVATLIESPSAKINAQEILELNSRGSSKTYFYGAGKVLLHEFLDSSELYKRKN